MKVKDINKMTAIEICKYLQEGNHDLPILMKHSEGYDLHYSMGSFHGRKPCFEIFKDLDKAIIRFKEVMVVYNLNKKVKS